MEESLADLRSRCKTLEEQNEKMKLQLKTLDEKYGNMKLQIKILGEENALKGMLPANHPWLYSDSYHIKLQEFDFRNVISRQPASTSPIANKEVIGDATHRETSLQQERQPGGGNNTEKSISEDIDIHPIGKDMTMRQSSNNESAPIVLMDKMDDEPDGQLEKLQMFRTRIVNLVRVTSHIINLMMDDLGTDEIDQIKGKSSEMEKTSALINVIERRITGGCQKAYKTFQKILGGIHPQLFETMFHRKPSNEERDFCIQPFRRSLRMKLQEMKEHGTDSRYDLPQDLDENFVQLRIIGSSVNIQHVEENNVSLFSDYQQQLQQEKSKTSNIDVKGIINQVNSGTSESRTVLVIGRAGIGKTTSVQWLSRQWALGEWAENMVLCFVIQLRVLFASTPKPMTLIQLLTKGSMYNIENCHLPPNWLRNNQGKGVLIMVDGLDEIAVMLTRLNSLDQKNTVTDVTTKTDPKKLLLNLIHGKILPHCTLICTSRPFIDLLNLVCNCAMYEILGPSQDAVKEYVHKKYPEKRDEIQTVLVQNPVLHSVCSITFYCTQVTKHLNNDSNLSEEEVATYTRLQSYILQQYASRRDTDLDDCIDDKRYFPKLAKLAYKGIFGGNLAKNLPKIVFSYDDLWQVGLTTEEVKKSSEKGVLICRGPCYEFFHLSVQELLSCIYILTSSDIDEDIMSKILDRLSIDGSLNMTLLYLFGVCFDNIDKAVMKNFPNLKGLSEHTASIQQKLWGFLDELVQFIDNFHDEQAVVQLCQIAHETQSPAVAGHVVETVVRDNAIHFEQKNFTALDIKALLFTCQSYKTLKKIHLSQCNLDDSSFKQIAEYLSSNSTVRELNLNQNQIQGPGLRGLGQMLAVNETLLGLHLEENEIKDEDAKWLVQGLVKNKTLTQLSLNGNLISDATAEGIAKTLTGTPWERLDLRSNVIGQKGAEALVDNSAHLKSKTILLGQNRIHQKRLHSWTEAFDFGRASLKSYVRFSELHHPGKVNMDDILLGDGHLNNVIEVLPSKETLYELCLCNNPLLTKDSLHKLGELAFESPALKKICLQGTGIDIPQGMSCLHFLLTNYLADRHIFIHEDIPIFSNDDKMKNEYRKGAIRIAYQSPALKTEDIRSLSNFIRQNLLLKQYEKISLIIVSVQQWSTVTCLSLSNQTFGPELLYELGPSLKRLKMTLRILELHNIKVNGGQFVLPYLLGGDDSEDLDTEVPLTTLDIVSPELLYHDLKAIIHAVRSHTNLKYLRLSIHVQFAETYAQQLGAAFSDNTILQKLTLQGCKLSERGFSHIFRGLQHHTALQALNICDNMLRGEGIVELSKLLKSTASISTLCIRGTKLRGDVEIKSLVDALRKTKHLKSILVRKMYNDENEQKDSLRDAITKRGIEQLDEWSNIQCFPDSPENFHAILRF